MLTAFQKFALISTIMCQHNEIKSCLNEFAETNIFFFFTAIWTINVRITLPSMSLQNDSLLCSNLYFSLFRIIHCSTETFTQICIFINDFLYLQLHKNFQIQNRDSFKQPIMATLMQRPFNLQYAADHFRH